MARARSLTSPAAPLLLALSLVASACGTEDGGPARECTSASTCFAASPCNVPTCVDGRCGTSPVAAGTFAGGRASGDCLRDVCDGAGGVFFAVPDDADLPDDGNACTADACAGGGASFTSRQAGTACAQDGGSMCDGAGACVQCLAAADCPGSDTECRTRTCSNGVCGTALAPLGTPLAGQTAGDCSEAVCDGLGGTTTAPLDTDLPSDGNACTHDLCVVGTPSHPGVAAGTACSGAGGAVVCDGEGACVECVTASACPGQDGECEGRTCTGGACGIGFFPFGTPVADQSAGDCWQSVCDGAGGVIGTFDGADVRVDGNACTEDSCSGGFASNPPSPAGTACAQSGGAVCDGSGACVACNVGADCPSRVCSGHVCQEPTCTDLAKNGDESDVDCGGTVCPKCAPPLACVVGADCTTGICSPTLLQCRNPSCSDGLRNGEETDVDCGGSACWACARGKACLAARDCATSNCSGGTCSGPLVTGVRPFDGASDVTPATAITVVFGRSVVAASAAAQAATGPCSGAVQISADGFATCLGVSRSAVAADGLSAAFQPAAALAAGQPYRVRTTTALSSSSLGAFEPFETPTGFTVAPGACAGKLVVSQVYPGGGLTGATYARDFVELHNNGPGPVTLDGLSVQYAQANTSTWGVTPLAGAIPAGGYYLVQMAGGATGAPLPAPDAAGASALSPVGGVVALVGSTLAPATYLACPALAVLDVVGYGSSSSSGGTTTPTSCREGTAPAPAPADSGAAIVRAGAGCADGNGNSFELVSALAVPRSSATPPVACGCNGTPVDETGLTVEMDRCTVQSPASLAATAGATAGPVYGRVFELTITDPAGPPAPLTAELGYGPAGTDPRYAAGWSFVPATWNAQFLDDDEFEASFTAPGAGSYVYAYRFSPDGQRWTYCDPDGAGSGAGLVFEPNALPPLTVAAP